MYIEKISVEITHGFKFLNILGKRVSCLKNNAHNFFTGDQFDILQLINNLFFLVIHETIGPISL